MSFNLSSTKYKAPLTREQEKVATRDELVEHNMKFAMMMVRKYAGSYGVAEFEDLLQEGLLGLTMAAEQFDPSLGHKFITIARYNVMGRIQRYIKNHRSTVRLPVNQYEKIRTLNEEKNAWIEQHGYTPSNDELAKHSKLGERCAKTTLSNMFTVTSMETPVSSEDSSTTFGDLLQLEHSAEDTQDKIYYKEIFSKIDNVLSGLESKVGGKRKVAVFRAHVDGLPVATISKKYKVNREEISKYVQEIRGLLKTQVLDK
ncbi:MAG TPA: sigma-70 family RNA polymerase sigma factor [Saccharofermentans sp.]|nr:sigma-70 family RNA polymerase sigma factor [Saccharofermentans sp.]